MKKLFFTVTIFVLTAAAMFAQTSGVENNENDVKITAVSSLELKRTKPFIIEQRLRKFIGRNVNDVDLNDVRATLEEMGTIEVLSIDLVDNGVDNNKTLQITAHDKWSFLGGPFFGIDSVNWSVGAAVFESNAFGLHDNIIAIGIYGTKEWSVTLIYEGIPEEKGQLGFSAGGSFAQNNVANTNQQGDTVLRRFKSMQIKPEGSIVYQFSDLLRGAFWGSYLYISPEDSESPLNAPAAGVQAISIGPRVNILKSSWDGYLLSEKSAALKYTLNIPINAAPAQTLALDAVFNHSLMPGFRLISKGSFLFSSGAVAPYFESPPVPAVSLLSSSYSASNYTAFSVGVEKYLFKFLFGTSFALSVSYQIAFSDSELLQNQFDHGPVAGLQLYFSKIAIPGMLLGGAYNADKNYFSFVFNMGLAL